jgi:heavy metal sensor kinase
MIRSFRLQLTIWYLALFSVLFIVFSTFLYGVVSMALRRQVEQTVASEAGIAAGLFLDEYQEMHGDVSKAATEAVAEMQGNLVAVFADRTMLAASSPGEHPELADVAARSSGTEPQLLIEISQYHRYGAVANVRRVQAGGREFLVIAFGSLDEVGRHLDALKAALPPAVLLTLALAGIGGYLLTSFKLRPLVRMASQARSISEKNLETRLDIGRAAEELTTLAQSFNELLSRLDLSFEGMRRFVADASHELRTPISVIRGEADVALSHDRSSAEYRESLAIILDESRRLSRLVDDLLNLARADAGHVQLQVKEFYFTDLLAECCRSVQALAAARRIELEYRADDDVPFRGDEVLLRRLTVNLLDNAIRYTPAGGKVSASIEAEEHGVRLRVGDTGPGIAPEAVPHIFERFYRADKARSREEGGFGLGLSIVKWIAESHHGVVELSSQPLSGSIFTVTLPR